MSLDKKFEDLFLNVSIKAALSSYHFVGKKDKIAADKSAVDAMRNKLNEIEMRGKVVIGEGELDEAPMLYIGETLGTMSGPELDIAVDPFEGTNFSANIEIRFIPPIITNPTKKDKINPETQNGIPKLSLHV